MIERFGNLWLLFLLCLCSVNIQNFLAAQDRVTYRPPGDAKPITLIGEVTEYTGRQLTMTPSRGKPKTIPADRIDGIETHYDPAHLKGLSLFQQGQTEAAAEQFRQALKREKREWVDREILSWLVRCSLRNDDLPGAIASFREIVHGDPDSRQWGVAPLVWAPMSISDAVKAEARQLLVSPRPSDRLLGASILLMDPVYGNAAERELRGLAHESNPRISGLSKAQQWRLELASRDVNELTLASWADDVRRLPQQLRGGPQYLIARGYDTRGEYRKAAAEYLWVSLVYSENDRLAARATLEAAESSRRTGLTREADVLYRELLFRFPWSQEAAAARTRTLDQQDQEAKGSTDSE